MPIRDILVGIATGSEADKARDYALAMAAASGAHVTGIAYALEHQAPFSIFPEFTADVIERHGSEAKKGADVARGRFAEAAKRAGVRHEALTGHGTVQQATSDFALRARTADLAVLAQHQSHNIEHVGDVFAEAALFHSGRPLILVPREYAGTFSNDRILIAWDGSVYAARAVAAAMPILSGAKSVEVFTVQEASKGAGLRGNDLVAHLRRHDLNVEFVQRDDGNIPEAIVREAGSFRASIVVMGGYGHSRVREFVFGGATRLMLSKMPAPVLMAH